jgi:DUF971 family protein
MSTSPVTPVNIDLKRDERLLIDWSDGTRSVYAVSLLRTMCPCALCRSVREGVDPHDISPKPAEKRKPALNILPGNFAQSLRVVNAELVGNYAIRLEWSDNHGSGIYSFQYLRELDAMRNKS